MFERGEDISFANCGLPYYVGGVIKDRDELLLQTPESFKRRFNVDVRVNNEVVAINRVERHVRVKNIINGNEYEEGYDVLILSPGGRPIVPSICGIETLNVFTLRNMEDTDKIKNAIKTNQPKTAIIIGGGFIGIEMAENLSEAGLEVAIVEKAKQILNHLDIEMAAEIHRYLRRKGLTLYLNETVNEIVVSGNGLSIRLDSDKIEADMVIFAVGVTPDTAIAREAGLKLNKNGGIVVDEYMKTSDPNIYAVGDAVEVIDYVSGETVMIPLAGPANKQARIAANNICGVPSSYNGTQGSSIIKVFEMTAASTGMNEKTARRLEIGYDKVYLWVPSHSGYYPNAKDMSLKVLFEKESGKIIGAQIVGFGGVDKRCDVLAVAVRAGMTAFDLVELELCYAPPYSSAKDPVNMAGFVIENTVTGRVKNFHWHDIDALARDGSVTLIDVRTPSEVKRGAIDGFNNIPLDDIRNCINMLDRSKPVYVHCKSGMRSYVAARILAQNGFEVYNLSGGYRLYDLMKEG